MRTQKRFTPKLLANFAAQGRGTGTFEDHIPWHRVGRSDPGSRGRSHLAFWRGRLRELLSDQEFNALLFATMLLDLLDAREQVKLSREDAPHEMHAYDVRAPRGLFPGTLSICRMLGLRHPRVHGHGQSCDWDMTTDQVLLRANGYHKGLHAVSVKAGSEFNKRERELLRIEHAYWTARTVPWLLITPQLYEASVGETLCRIAPWGLDLEVPTSDREIAVSIAKRCVGQSLTFTLNAIATRLESSHATSCAFWQSVWLGELPLDLRRGWRPHLPIQLLRPEEFATLNPVASGRSAWL